MTREANVSLKKNLWAKVAAVVASLAALGTTLGLVQRNSPPSAGVPSPAAAASVTPPRSTRSSRPGVAPAPITSTHTRTHVS